MNGKILVTGGGSGVARELLALLAQRGYGNVKAIGHADLDLTRQAETEALFAAERPDIVAHIAARPSYPRDHAETPWGVCRDNLLMEANVFDASARAGARKILWLSSALALPHDPAQPPMAEPALLTGATTPSNESYALAKAVGVRMLEYLGRQTGMAAVALLPCHVYGAGQRGLVDAVMQDFLTAKASGAAEVVMWGRADWKIPLAHNRDVASALLFCMEHDMKHAAYIVGPERAVSKAELAAAIARAVGYGGRVAFDEGKAVSPPVNAVPARLMAEGWRPMVALEDGLAELCRHMEGER